MKVSIMAANLSSNGMGRVYVLARVLSRRYEVEVVGPMFGDGVWGPIAGEGLDIRSLEMSKSPLALTRLRKLPAMATGDVAYACKPVWTSLGAALSARSRRGIPVVLDVDDWEWGLAKDAIRRAPNRARVIASGALRAHLPYAWPNAWLGERLVPRADALTVSNSFLQRRFGGAMVWHGRDTGAFDPARYASPVEARRSLRAEDGEKIVMFFGTIRPHKGVDDLVDAVARLKRPDVRLVLVGVDDGEAARDAASRARLLLKERVSVLGTQPFARVPELVAAADVVVVPQRKTAATAGQMPAKLFDAMAMARPVVATDVCDVREALEGCGWIVPPGSPERLAVAIANALENPGKARAAGSAARRRCIERYSWDAMERTLAGVFELLERR